MRFFQIATFIVTVVALAFSVFSFSGMIKYHDSSFSSLTHGSVGGALVGSVDKKTPEKQTKNNIEKNNKEIKAILTLPTSFFYFLYILFLSLLFFMAKKTPAQIALVFKNNIHSVAVIKRLSDFCEKISVAFFVGLYALAFDDDLNIFKLLSLSLIFWASFCFSIAFTKAINLISS